MIPIDCRKIKLKIPKGISFGIIQTQIKSKSFHELVQLLLKYAIRIDFESMIHIDYHFRWQIKKSYRPPHSTKDVFQPWPLAILCKVLFVELHVKRSIYVTHSTQLYNYKVIDLWVGSLLLHTIIGVFFKFTIDSDTVVPFTFEFT